MIACPAANQLRHFLAARDTAAVSHLVHWELVKQGAGIGLITEAVGDAEPRVCRVLPEAAPIVFPIWLVSHREMHASRRVRVVFDLLADALSLQR